MKMLLPLFVLISTVSAFHFPLHNRVVNCSTSKLLEFSNGGDDKVTHVSYDRQAPWAFHNEFEKHEIPYVTLPFGRFNVTMSLANMIDIWTTTYSQLEKNDEINWPSLSHYLTDWNGENAGYATLDF